MQHELKILPQYFKAVADGSKTFEIRFNDGGFKVGDTLVLKEIENKTHKSPLGNFIISDYTGREITKEVSYIQEGGQYELKEGYCILGLKDIDFKGMQITIKGTEKEIQVAKDVMDNTCVFNSEYCETGSQCKECEKKHNLKISYVTKESEEK